MIQPNDAPLNTPLWCVYGPDCFSTMFCCMINEVPGYGRNIWGYSIHKRSPGFRTLGRSVDDWMQDKNAKFFLTQDEAIQCMIALTTPKKSALDKLRQK